MDRVERLIALFHRRWGMPILAELERSGGAKFVTLVHRVGRAGDGSGGGGGGGGASEGAVRQALDDLIARGWVRRNPGYGHPLRPEYILTRAGGRIAPVCVRLEDALDSVGARAVALRKWSMPVLDAVADGPRRFRQIAEHLTGITDRALAIALKDLSSSDLIERQEADPTAIYRGTPRGLVLAPVLAEL